MGTNELKHIGMPRRSGRYPWGSGKDPYQSASSFLGMIDEFRKEGKSDKDIYEWFGITSGEYRANKSLARDELWMSKRAEVLRLQEKGMSNVAIGKQMGINESSVRSFLDPVKAERAKINQNTMDALKENIKNFGYIDIGTGAENKLKVSRDRLDAALIGLQEEGYNVLYPKVEQMGIPGQYTSMRVLAPPGIKKDQYEEVSKNWDIIQPIHGRSEDNGRTISDLGLKPIQSVSVDRVMIRYQEEGGSNRDGVIELRRGVSDLDLGKANYAQVRIGVDDTHYMKGMAMYSDNIPEGIDIIYNTNKKIGTPIKGSKDNTVMKNMKEDPDNPFGTTMKRMLDEEGNAVYAQKGALNIVREEGDWNTWSKTLASQFLSKQPTSLAKQQLDLAYQLKKEEYEEIAKLTNPSVKKKLLMSFADDCDSSAVDLSAHKMPRQSTKVILPVPDLKDGEVYAPTYNNGERVVLVRYPHGGLFEIPDLKVNNKSPSGKAILGTRPIDAIGINPMVAQKLSGADFDGDTVIVIPNPMGAIKTKPSLDKLKDFDHIERYKIPEGSNIKKITPQYKQNQMGVVTNLIADMTIRGATDDELAHAVRHSMVVIDSEKHGLDYRQSAKDNGISSLALKYQGKARGGAATIISRASSQQMVEQRKTRIGIDPETGAKIYYPTGETYVQRKVKIKSPTTGRLSTVSFSEAVRAGTYKKEDWESLVKSGMGTETIITKKIKSTKMAEAEDAYKLSSGFPIENLYADYANKLKALGNQARKEHEVTKTIPYSPSAKQTYKKDVTTLMANLDIAEANAPRERDAQRVANAIVARKVEANPVLETDKDSLKKVRTQALAEARVRTGAKKIQIPISENEWEAIQSGALTNHQLNRVLNNANLDKIKQLATPRQEEVKLSDAKVKIAENKLRSGYTLAEVAQSLNVSVSYLTKLIYD